ncbi:transmembrane anchor protein [Caballeronia sp. J97]|uniref:transmembrane anchor protein n=1 Tax=Caballeronia sp. J97 TaxID=2805429 RepID=UPI002AAF7C01|nr:transmembrane anchor protein [Caballeronia sp. J97]
MNQLEVSNQTLAKATAGAVATAAVILTLFVLPAERGIDVTGIGRALGLTGMAAGAARAEPAAPSLTPLPAAAGAMPNKLSISKATPYRSDEMELVLPPNAGAEIKAQMHEGDHLVFRWEATGGPVNVDMHGERPNAGKAYTSYWKAVEQTGAQGAFNAPFDGTHGWYWRNRGDRDVVIKVRTDGFYAKLFRPEH